MADRGLDVGAWARWPGAMAAEVLRLPEVLADTRRLLRDLSNLADRLDQVARQVEDAVGELTVPLDRAMVQVDSIEASVTELRTAFFTLLKRVPGARTMVWDAIPGLKPDTKD